MAVLGHHHYPLGAGAVVDDNKLLEVAAVGELAALLTPRTVLPVVQHMGGVEWTVHTDDEVLCASSSKQCKTSWLYRPLCPLPPCPLACPAVVC